MKKALTLSDAYYNGRAAPKGTRCPFSDEEFAAEWRKGRSQARREEHKDLRPAWRRRTKRPRAYA